MRRLFPGFAGIFALLFGLFAAGCDDDPVGPIGPVRDAGVSAFELDFLLDDATFNETVASVQYEVPAITPAVVEGGAVLMFFWEQGTWTAMPYTYGVESPDLAAVDYTVTLGYGYDVGLVEVFYEVSSTEAIPLGTLPDQEIKVVVIEGFGAGKADVDLTDYEAVKRYFGLKD